MGAACQKKCFGDRRYYCSFELALEIIGGKWKSLVLWHLGAAGIMRFGELRRHLPKITQRMLTRQLRELAGDGLVLRVVYPQVPPKVEYSLTKLGRRAVPLLRKMAAFGQELEETRAVAAG